MNTTTEKTILKSEKSSSLTVSTKELLEKSNTELLSLGFDVKTGLTKKDVARFEVETGVPNKLAAFDSVSRSIRVKSKQTFEPSKKYKGKKYNLDKKFARLQIQAADESLLYATIGKFMQRQFFTSHNEEFGRYFKKLYEDVIFYVVDICSQPLSFMNVERATMRFVKYRYGLVFCVETLNDLVSKFVSFYKMLVGCIPQNQEPLHLLRDLLDKFSDLRKSALFKKLYKFIMYVLCTSVLEQFGASKKFSSVLFEKLHIDATIKKKFTFGIDFFHCIFDTLVYVCEVGYQCFQMGSFEPIFHSGNNYRDWFDKACELKRNSLLTANCEAHGFTLFEFLHDLDDAIEKGESIAKYASRVGNTERKSVLALLNDLKIIRSNELTKKAAAQTRKAPFSLLVHGGSSVGKTSFTDMLFAVYAKIHNMPWGDEYVYTRNPSDPYWSSFRTCMWGIKLDDIGFLRPDKAPNGDPSLLEMLQVINNVSLTPPQAELCDKGRTPVKSRFVTGTSNAIDLNAFHYFSCSLAVRRRLPWVVSIKPKQQYAKFESMLDPSKLPPLVEGCLPNYWIITVFRIEPDTRSLDNQGAILTKQAEYTDINVFMAWFAATSLEFDRLQKLALNVTQQVNNIELCKQCYYTSTLCQCVRENQIVRVQAHAEEEMSEWVRETTRRICASEQTAEETVVQSLSQWEAFKLWAYYNIADRDVVCILVLCLSVIWSRCFIWSLFPMLFLVWYSQFFQNYLYGQTTMIIYHTRLVSTPLGAYYWRRFLTRVGDTVNGMYSHPGLSLCMISSLGAIVYAVSLFVRRDWACKTQSVEEVNPGVSPETDEEESDFNPWYKDNFQVTNLDVSDVSRSYKGLGAEKVMQMLRTNCVYFHIKGFRSQRAFCVGGHFYLVNSHGLPKEDFVLTVTEQNNDEGVTSNLKSILITENMINRMPEKDLALVIIRNLPPKRDVCKLFCKTSLQGRWKGCYVGRNKQGAFTQLKIDNIRLEKNLRNEYLGTETDSWVGNVEKDTEDGDCGYVMFVMTPSGPIILGIHYLGGMESKTVISVKVTDDDINSLLLPFKNVVVQSGYPELSAPNFERKLGPLHKKSVFRFIEDGTARVYGSFLGFRPNLKSHVRKTMLNDALVHRGMVQKHTAPLVHGYTPWRIAALDLTDPVTHLRQDILQECRESFTKDILDRLDDKELKKIVVYDYFTALNGAAGVKFVDKLNRNTSMGCPWKKCKKAFLRPVPPVGGLQDPVEFDEDVMERVHNIEACYRNGQRVCPVFCGNLKDEAVSFAKREQGKTRVFCGAPADWSMVVRKYLLSFIRVVQRNSYVFESAPGVVAQSLQWEKIYEYLTFHGKDRIVAGDYKAFDKRMGSVVILSAFDIIIDVCRSAGYSEKDLLVVACIAEDTAFSFVDFNGDLVEYFGSNPSGHPLTVIINGLVNSLYMRYCYSSLSPERNCIDFKQKVNLMTYGDDNIMGVSSDISFFNHTSIVRALGQVGIVYTMPDKLSESVPFINIQNADFLKRRFVYDEDVGAILAPLDESSIEKSLLVCVESKSMSHEHQCIDIIGSAVREYFNYGKPIFEKRVALLKSVVSECNLEVYVNDSTFPTFEDLKTEFWKASEKISVSKLSLQAEVYCPRCWNSTCQYKHDIQDDLYLLCVSCWHCVDFGEHNSCPRCGNSIYCEFDNLLMEAAVGGR